MFGGVKMSSELKDSVTEIASAKKMVDSRAPISLNLEQNEATLTNNADVSNIETSTLSSYKDGQPLAEDKTNKVEQDAKHEKVSDEHTDLASGEHTNLSSNKSSEHATLASDEHADSLGAGATLNTNESKHLKHHSVQDDSSLNVYGRHGNRQEAQFIDPDKKYFKPWVESYPEDVPEFVDTRPYENIDEMFMSAVSRHQDHTAFISFESSLTFNEVADLAESFAAFVQVKLGMKKGDKLAIMMPNLMQYPVVFFGALKAGLTVININPLYTPRELQQMLDNSDATAIVVLANVAHNLQSILDKTKLKHVIISSVGDCLGFFKGLVVDTVVHVKGLVPHFEIQNSVPLRVALRRGQQCIDSFVKPAMCYDDLALLQYTGGTTGRSKGAMLTHGNLIANVSQAIGVYGSRLNGNKETILTVIPMYHIFALTVNLILMFEIGARNLLIADPRDINSFIKTLRNHPDITTLTGVNTLFNLFVSNPEFKKLEWKNLHLVIGGGAAVQSGVEERFFQHTGQHILEGYGLTECSPLCAVCPYTIDHYTGSIGLIVPSTIARIVDINGEEIHDMERAGELEIKGPQVMKGYYKCDETQNEQAYDEGYLRTGDIARWMEGGYIKLIDRLKDMILVSGFNVFPSEIEDVVSRFNRILECAVVGVPSEKTGEAVKMFVVKKDPALTEDEIKNYCRAYLTPYKVPTIIEFVNVLPKSGLGKVLRRRLRENNAKVEAKAASMSVQAQTSTEAMASFGNKQTNATMGMAAYSLEAQSKLQERKEADAILHLASKETEESYEVERTPFGMDKRFTRKAQEAEIKKSTGALALERLLSSTSEGFDAATTTPNIHHASFNSGKKQWQRNENHMPDESDD